MATKMSLPAYLTSPELPTSKNSRSRFPAVCLCKTSFSFGKRLYSRLCFFHVAQHNSKRLAWSIRSSADGSGLNPSPTNNGSSGTRLIRAIQAIQIKLNARIKELRKHLPMKLLFFLVGFYCATAFATVIGQTGDWDILAAALAVAVVEGIGALMYRASLPLFDKRTDEAIWLSCQATGVRLGSISYPLWDMEAPMMGST